MSLWTAEDVARATGGRTGGSWSADAVVIDSRAVKPGDLFIAIKGERMDGHDFVAEALKRGAAGAVVSQPVKDALPEKLVMVEDTLRALQAMGVFNRARSSAKIIGVTGSVGKTSAKEMLRTALAPHGNIFASHGNFNNHIGTPFNLANLPADAQFAIFEMGMNHSGEISELTRMVRPDVSIITNVEAVHLEFFASVTGIADAKSEIFEGMGTSGAAVLNRDNDQFERCRDSAKLAGITRILSFGVHAEADFRLLSYRASLSGSEIEALLAGEKIRYRLGTIGKHWANASLGILAVVSALGLDMRVSADALSACRELPGRGRLIPIRVGNGEATLIDDSYNASPAAMRAAFRKLHELREAGAAKGRVIAALGDMRELGETSAELHADLASDLKAAQVDLVFTAGEMMKYLHDKLPEPIRAAHTASADALIPLLLCALKVDDLILVKGSHGSHMYEVAEALMHPEKELKNAL